VLTKKEVYTVAVVGATGAVGRELLEVLGARKFPVGALRLFASKRSAGTVLECLGRQTIVETLGARSFAGVDLAFISVNEEESRRWAPVAVAAGAVVIDDSAAFRLDPQVPLVVPEVNGETLQSHRGIIAIPNCSTTQLVMVLKPLHDAARVKRVVVSSYQSVTGTGKRAADELLTQSASLINCTAWSPEVYPHQIAFNLIPQIGSFVEGGSTTEEMKLVHETRKILGDDGLRLTATTVRVPVFRGHAEAVTLELSRKLTVAEARERLAGFPGVVVEDEPETARYPMPVTAVGRDAVFVGRLREDPSVEYGLHCWIVADNLRKGAALNAVQIAERLIS